MAMTRITDLPREFFTSLILLATGVFGLVLRQPDPFEGTLRGVEGALVDLVSRALERAPAARPPSFPASAPGVRIIPQGATEGSVPSSSH